MPTPSGRAVMERRRTPACRLRLIAGIAWPYLMVACAPLAGVLHPANAGATAVSPGRSGHAAPEPPSAEMTPPVLVAPANHAIVSAATGRTTKVRLSWQVAGRRNGRHDFVEVMTRGDDGTHDVYAAYVTGSYTTVRLPSVSGIYVWRVYATGDHGGSGHYAPSGWGRFSVATRSAQR